MSLPAQSHTESRPNQKEQRLKTYLQERTRSGDRYFKSKYIATELGLSSKEVGALLVKLRASAETLTVEKWSQTSPATWYVRPSTSAADTTNGALQ